MSASLQRKPEPTCLELMAYLGMSRHSGGWRVTAELVELCHVDPVKQVLDFDCGIDKGGGTTDES